MDRDIIIRLAVQAGITPWAKKEWSKDRFVQTDEGMDGDAACLIQFAALVAAHERETILDEWWSCVQADLEHGVKFLNEQAAEKWQRDYPQISKFAAAIRSRT